MNCFVGPDNTPLKVRTRTLPSGYLRAEFTPDRIGTYDVAISEGSKALILPEPLEVKVFDPILVRLKDKNDTAVLGLDYTFKGLFQFPLVSG